MRKHILIVDDEQDIIEVLSYNLQKEGYAVTSCLTGYKALAQDFSEIDLIILDVMLPGMDGYEICKQLKTDHRTSHIPIIFLTAKNNIGDEVHGLDIGAEDYIIKPISIPKLLARIKTALRREPQVNPVKDIIIIDGIEVDVINYSVRIDKAIISFTKKEFETLLFLIKNKNKIVTREALLSKIWGHDVVVGARTIDVHIRNIRDKLGYKKDVIKTIKGIGYRFESND